MKNKTARNFAIKAHGNQLYGGNPYIYHLDKVVKVLKDYGLTGFIYEDAGYLHDVIEDTSVTLQELQAEFGTYVAELVWSVTGEGKNRKERQESIYAKLKDNHHGINLKLADRIANLETGFAENNQEKLKMYKKEDEKFSEIVKIGKNELFLRYRELIDSIA